MLVYPWLDSGSASCPQSTINLLRFVSHMANFGSVFRYHTFQLLDRPLTSRIICPIFNRQNGIEIRNSQSFPGDSERDLHQKDFTENMALIHTALLLMIVCVFSLAAASLGSLAPGILHVELDTDVQLIRVSAAMG